MDKDNPMTEPTKPAATDSAAPRRKVLVFHIGHHKTGSTSIQNAFATGRVRLQGRTVFYPANLNHNYLEGQITGAAKGKTKFADREGMPALDRLPGMIEAAEDDYALISGESFEGIDPELFHDMVTTRFAEAADAVRVLCYVRPHASRVLSTFAEQSKIGRFRGDLDGFFDKPTLGNRLLYAPRLQGWRDRFGDAFIARPMIRSCLKGQSVLEDFVASAFDDTPCEIDPAPASNESLSLQDLVMLRYVQKHLGKIHKGLRLGFGWEMARVIGQNPGKGPGEKLQLHRSLAERMRVFFLEDARAIDRKFFGDRGLFERALDEAVDTARPEAQSLAPRDHFSAEELRNMTIMAEMLAGMLGNDAAKWNAYFRRCRVRAARGAGKAAGG